MFFEKKFHSILGIFNEAAIPSFNKKIQKFLALEGGPNPINYTFIGFESTVQQQLHFKE